MKVTVATILLSATLSSAWAESFQSTIYRIEKGKQRGEAHLVKFDNGRVAFVEARDLEALEESRKSGDVLELSVDEQYNLVAATTVETGAGLQSREEKNLPPEVRNMSYEPTVVKGLTAAKNIFSRMKKGWQNDSQCYNRAHVWASEEFNRSGLKSIKLFLFFTNRYIRNYRYKWWFHVSPMAMVKEGSATNRRVLDRRYTSGPRFVKTWTDIFMHNNKTCPVVSKYSEYDLNQEKQDCYLFPVSQYYWQPRDMERFERTGQEKQSFIPSEVEYAYWEAF